MTWQLDPAHTSVTFSVKHMMVTTVRGTMKIADMQLDFDPEHPESGSVSVELDATSIDTGAEQRDAHLRSGDFLDVETYPTLTFRSTSIDRRGESTFKLHGNLTIRDQTHPVTLGGELDGIVPNLQGGQRASFSASTKLNREEWGLTWNVALEQGGWLVSKNIRIEMDVAIVEAAEGGPQRETVGATSA